jgi:hypothetical protein
MAECKKCIHNAVCKTAESCDGYVSGCKHFNEGWISVKERLPEKYHTVLTARKDDDWFDIDTECINANGRWSDDYKVGTCVTHWMPLPQPPKGE